MKTPSRYARLAALAASLCAASAVAKPVSGSGAAARDPRPGDAPLVQIALLLDTSNSMDGLIAQAKTQLWKVVNEFAHAKRNGQTPRLEVALYEYGNDSLSAASGHIRRVLPLTSNLDDISEKLFALRTNGGQEYCGQVIGTATRELDWSKAAALKMIFIAGNEPFTQGPESFRETVRAASAKGILVNTIFCGAEREGVATGWRDGAVLSDGRFAFIDSNRAVAVVNAPQDAELARLGAELNKTYVGYGAQGTAAKARQEAQDKNAASAGMGAVTTRAMAKSSAHYRNDDWDLVDGAKSGKIQVESAPAAALPVEMQSMTAEQRKEHVEALGTRRAELQAKMRKLESERRAYVAAEEKKQAEASGAKTLDQVMVGTVREQAAKVDFAFE